MADSGKRKAKQATLAFQSDSTSKKARVDSMSTDDPNLPHRRKALPPVVKKKLVIKPFAVKPKPPEEFEQQTLTRLDSAITAVFTAQAVDSSQEELYRAVESLCMHKKASSLYDRLYQRCQQQAQHTMIQLASIAPTTTSSPSTFLPHLDTSWRAHCDQMLTIRSIFLYLDRTFVIQSPVKSLWEMGLQLYGGEWTKHPIIEQQTRAGLLILIERERMGETIDRSLVKSLLRMLMALKLYKTVFEDAFLDATTTFYTTESSRLMSELNIPDYLQHVHRRLTSESDRCHSYLDDSTSRPLLLRVEQTLIAHHVTPILTTGLDPLLQAPRIHELGLLYRLLARVDALGQLKDAYAVYIKRTGLEIVKEDDTKPEKDANMVQNLLAFKTTLDTIMTSAFANNDTFLTAMKQSFESFINQRPNKPAELIAKFIDKQLRTGSKTTDEELERILDQVMYLFRYIQGKDVFQAFYKKDLAKRLLLGSSASIDAEKSMIAKIKSECGATFTTKLEGMFKDIELSKDIHKEFQTHLQSIPNFDNSIEISVQVLTTGSWPAYPAVECKLPEEVQRLQDNFRLYYLNKHSGRRLVWQNTLATCILRAHFPKGKKELAVSGFQAAVLCCFNEMETLSFKQIQEMTNLDEKELKVTLQSLALGPIAILMKNPNNKKIDVADRFRVDKKFTHALYRLKINSIQQRETVEDQKQTTAKVFEDRQYAIDACIVRIMKSRKQLLHNQLISETVSQLKFPATIPDIKKRITSLIEREYIERDKDNSQMYIYQA